MIGHDLPMREGSSAESVTVGTEMEALRWWRLSLGGWTSDSLWISPLAKTEIFREFLGYIGQRQGLEQGKSSRFHRLR